MIEAQTINASEQLVCQVRKLTADKLRKIDPNQLYGLDTEKLVHGKMLRTLLAAAPTETTENQNRLQTNIYPKEKSNGLHTDY